MRKLRWAEPVGQILVLLAVGIQLFWIVDLNSMSQAYDRQQQFQQISRVNYDIIKVLEVLKVPLDAGDSAAKAGNSASLIGNADYGALITQMEYRRKYYTKMYIAVFIIGSLLIIMGKSASIVSSK